MNQLIQAGTLAVTGPGDILTALEMTRSDPPRTQPAAKSEEVTLLALLAAGTQDSASLIEQTVWEVATFNRVITLMEISGKVRRLHGGTWITR